VRFICHHGDIITVVRPHDPSLPYLACHGRLLRTLSTVVHAHPRISSDSPALSTAASALRGRIVTHSTFILLDE
jgi:hypothetical protein